MNIDFSNILFIRFPSDLVCNQNIVFTAPIVIKTHHCRCSLPPSILELSVPIQPQQKDIEDDTLPHPKLVSNSNVEANEHQNFNEVKVKNEGSDSPYFSTYYNPMTPPSPDTIIEVDPEQFRAEVCLAIGEHQGVL